MERWAANSLRTLANILLAGFVLISSLFLLLLSLCAWAGVTGNSHPRQALGYLIAALIVMVVGSLTSGWLSRGIIRSAADEPPQPPSASVLLEGSSPARRAIPSPPVVSVPLHFSHHGQTAINNLALALMAQIAFSAVTWFFDQLHLWTAPRALAPHNWTLILLAPFVLSHLPYAILIGYLLKKPDTRTFCYALVVPIITVVQALFSISVVTFVYAQQPMAFLLLLIPWFIHIVIIVLAFKAVETTGLHPEQSSIMTAIAATVAYFFFIHILTPVLYQLARRY